MHADDHAADGTAYNDLNLRAVFMIGFLGAVLLIVIITGAQVLYYKWQSSEYQTKQIDVPLASVDRELEAQREVIGRYGYNEDSGGFAVPVEAAMGPVVEELRKTAPAGPEATPGGERQTDGQEPGDAASADPEPETGTPEPVADGESEEA